LVALVVAVVADVLLGLLAGPQSGLVSTVSLVALYSVGRYLPVTQGWAAGGAAVLLLAVPAVVQDSLLVLGAGAFRELSGSRRWPVGRGLGAMPGR
jgi:hypothetical protein